MSRSVGDALQDGLALLTSRSIPDARLDTELLLAHAMGVDRAWLMAHPEAPLSSSQSQSFESLVAERATGKPFAYVVGEQEFYGRAFTVSSSVLIPRPDTEVLVEATLAVLSERAGGRVLEIGVGSGAVILSLALEWSGAAGSVEWLGIEISEEALAVAVRNRTRWGAEAVDLRLGDGLGDFPGSFDVVVVNPPYVEPGDPRLEDSVARFEPELAFLDRRDGDGLGHYRRYAREVPPRLAPGGTLIVEVGEDQASAVSELFTAEGGRVQLFKDLAGIERVVRADFDGK